MFDPATLLAYTAAAAVLVLIPGPGTAWIIAQSAAGGARRGAQAAVGLETATLIHALAAGLGLSAVLATSALAFEIVKYAGAAYLVWLGIQAWRERDASAGHPAAPAAVVPARQVYLRSVLTGVLNPKVALFFLAFLPQFVDPARGAVPLQFLLLGLILSVIGLCHSLMLSWLVGRMGRRLAGSPRAARWKRRITGGVFIALGLRLATQARS
jgi:threonine/homoserine/homoserine lactone efflux protein